MVQPDLSDRNWTNCGKHFRRRPYKFLRLKLRGHQTESCQIFTRCREMIAS